MNVRIESDSMGQVEVAADRTGARRRSARLQNFKIGGHRFGRPVIRAFGIVKKAAALTNHDLGKLDAAKTRPHRRARPTRSSPASSTTTSRSSSGRRAAARSRT